MKNKTRPLMLAAAITAGSVALCAPAFAGELVPLSPEDWPLTANMKRAHSVDVREVKTLPGERTSVVARLTFDNGSQVTCRYVMQTKVIDVDGKTGIQFLLESENCGGVAPSRTASVEH